MEPAAEEMNAEPKETGETRHEAGTGHRCDLGKWSQLGLKVVFFAFPFIVGFSVWVVTTIHSQEINGKLRDARLDVIDREVSTVKTEQSQQGRRVYHMDVIEERLTALVRSMEEVKSDIKEVKQRL